MSKIDNYYALQPTRYRVLKSVTLAQVANSATHEMQQQISLILAKDDTFLGDMLYLEFSGVRNLKLTQPTWSLITFSDLNISSVRLDDNKSVFIICDNEEDVLSFQCDDFIAVEDQAASDL